MYRKKDKNCVGINGSSDLKVRRIILQKFFFLEFYVCISSPRDVFFFLGLLLINQKERLIMID
jgi:hypothetical protein